MKKLLTLILITINFVVVAQTVSNVVFFDYNQKVIIKYNLQGSSDCETYLVKLYVSENCNNNFRELTTGVTGDIGFINPGKKMVEWTPTSSIKYNNCCFKVEVVCSFKQTAKTDNQPTYNDLPTNMALIKAGSFTMGSPASEVDRYDDETQHTVKLTYNFLMGKYEVTQGEYEALMGTNPSGFSGCDNCPVENVTWFDAIKYCNALSKKEGFAVAYNETTGDLLDANGNVTKDITKVEGYRLPTEAEWEYSCRSVETLQATSLPFSTGNNLTTSQANYDGNYPYNGNNKGTYREKTIEVGSFSPNSWGLYDMHGNVWEWCHDWKATYPNSATNPIGADRGSSRVLRGGSWSGNGGYCRSAARSNDSPSGSGYFIGFRLCRVP